MADTQAATGLRVQRWEDTFFKEYLTENRYSESMGSDENSVIQVKEVLGKGKGDSTTIALVNKLQAPAVTGSNMLEGAEEDMSSRSQRIFIDKRRNAVRIAEMEEIKSAIDLRDAGRAVLKDWSMKDTERLITNALGSIDGVDYAATASNAAARNAWNTANWDRVLYGALRGNNGATAGSVTHANALITIDNTADKLTPQAISLMKEMALTCDPKITPIRVEKTKGRRYYVLYANTRAMRELKTNSSMMQAQREVTLEVENNRLFEGGDLLWDGVIVKEVPDIGFTTNGTIEVAPTYFCGAQSVAVVYGKRWRTITKEFDYGDKYGIAIEGIMGVRKMQFGTGPGDTDTLKDNGVITGWFAAVVDVREDSTMATAFTAANAAATFSPPKPIGAGVRFVIWGTYNFATAIVINDTVAICKIPANTYVIDGYLRGVDIDTGTAALKLDVGWMANGVDAANSTGFLTSPVLSGSAVTDVLGASGIRMPFQGVLQSGGPKLFTVDTTVLVTATAAANAGGTGLITVMLDCFNA